jgi:hypothetical protein
VRVVAAPALGVDQVGDEGLGLGALRGQAHPGVVGVGSAVEDVVAHRTMQERGVR